MDFLDPRKRRAHHIRLIIGYVLVAVAIALGTVIVVYGANGYGVNTKTGEIIQNGLVFVDSQPAAATIVLNDKDQGSKTGARLVLPVGNYSLSLQKAGYQSWQKDFNLDQQTIERFVYPFLFPTEPHISSLRNYSAKPGLITQSPDRRWLLVQTSNSNSLTFDMVDTTTLDQAKVSFTSFSVPTSALPNYSTKSKISLSEWSADNNNFVVANNFPGGREFALVSRNHPENSININSTLDINPDQINLFNKKSDSLYVYTASDETLRLMRLDKTSSQVILKNVLAYKPYGSSLILYVTESSVRGQVVARIWESGKTYPLYSFSTGNNYLIDIAKYQGDFYYIAGSDSASRVDIFKNPLSNIKNADIGKAVPMIALRNQGATQASFSDISRFVLIEKGDSFAVYDIETSTSYKYTLSQPLDATMKWLDGYRLIGSSKNRISIVDFDNQNPVYLSTTTLASGGFFARDLKHMLTIDTQKGGWYLKDIDLRAGTDLPKNLAR